MHLKKKIVLICNKAWSWGHDHESDELTYLMNFEKALNLYTFVELQKAGQYY